MFKLIKGRVNPESTRNDQKRVDEITLKNNKQNPIELEVEKFLSDDSHEKNQMNQALDKLKIVTQRSNITSTVTTLSPISGSFIAKRNSKVRSTTTTTTNKLLSRSNPHIRPKAGRLYSKDKLKNIYNDNHMKINFYKNKSITTTMRSKSVHKESMIDQIWTTYTNTCGFWRFRCVKHAYGGTRWKDINFELNVICYVLSVRTLLLLFPFNADQKTVFQECLKFYGVIDQVRAGGAITMIVTAQNGQSHFKTWLSLRERSVC